MRIAIGTCLLSVTGIVSGFTPSPTWMRKTCVNTIVPSRTTKIQASIEHDCGCGPTVFEGKPSNTARTDIDHRDVIANISIFKVDGTETTLDGIIGKSSQNPNRTSLVVFLRSLG
jgi:hypothetical protein